MRSTIEPRAIQDLLPHRRPMLLLTAIETVDDLGIRCLGWIDQGFFVAAEGQAPAILGLEMGAQAAGVHHAVKVARHAEPGASKPRRGFLVGIRSARFIATSLPTDATLSIDAIEHGTAGPLAIYDITVTGSGSSEALVEGRVSIWAE